MTPKGKMPVSVGDDMMRSAHRDIFMEGAQ